MEFHLEHIFISNWQRPSLRKITRRLILTGVFASLLLNPFHLLAQDLDALDGVIGKNDAILLTDSAGRILWAKNRIHPA